MKLIRVVLAGFLVFAVSATALEKHGRDIHTRSICQVRFVPLIGRAGWNV